MKNTLQELTTSQPLVKRLIALGVEPIGGVLWHSNRTEDDITAQLGAETWEVCYMPFAEYMEDFALPAWTKEEIDVMIGGEYNKPDVAELSRVSQSDIQAAAMIKKIKPEDYYPDFIIISLHEKEYRFYKAADASATALIWALENKKLKVEDCNKRYLSFYK